MFPSFLGIFLVKANSGPQIEESQWHHTVAIPVKNVHNFRSLEEIKNMDGRTIKKNVFFRSANLHSLSNAEVEKLKNFGIRKVIDLRTDAEVKKEKDHLPQDFYYLQLSAFNDHHDLLKKGKSKILSGKINSSNAEEFMHDFYRRYLIENPKIIQKIMLEILNSETPVLYHCTEGKDRTGMITMLILHLLKVDQKTIFQEYLLSNNHLNALNLSRLNKAHQFGFIFPKFEISALEKMLWVESSFLKTAIQSVEENYGSLDQYIAQELQISENDQKKYIEKFTEKN